MNPVKRILGHIYFFYCMIVFLGFMLLIPVPVTFLTSRIKEPLRAKINHPFFRLWIGIVFPLMLTPLRRKGEENFAEGENYVVVVNHNSFLDIPAATPWIPGPTKTLAKIEFAKIPVFNLVYKTGSILVDRKDESSRKESFVKMQQVLKMGLHLCLFPEGTRNKTEEVLLPFFEGAFVTAIRAQKPVIPAVLFNTKKIMPDRPKFWGWPRSIRYHFLDPIPTEGLSIKNRIELMNQVHKIMEDYILEHQNEF